jgi:hypothetical protein
LLLSLSLLFTVLAQFLNITYGKKRGTDTVLIVNPHSASGSTGKDWDNLYAIAEIIDRKEIRVKVKSRIVSTVKCSCYVANLRKQPM